jgi:hypothetical protein
MHAEADRGWARLGTAGAKRADHRVAAAAWWKAKASRQSMDVEPSTLTDANFCLVRIRPATDFGGMAPLAQSVDDMGDLMESTGCLLPFSMLSSP